METTKQEIFHKRFDVGYTLVHHKSGLDLYIMDLAGFSSVEAAFVTKYGSVNTKFRSSSDMDFTTVPEGIAHYLEHKLFENEECDAFELYAKTGARANAYTSFDHTAYTFSCSEKYLDNLEILLDFVQKPYFTQATVDKERGIIGQEIKMCIDSPDRQCFYNLLKAMYKNNSVRIDIAGTVESIQQIDADLLYNCYNTFYNLHNMALCISGDIDVDEIIKVCDKVLKPADDLFLETDFSEEPYEINEKKITAKYTVGTPIFNIGYKSNALQGEELVRKQLYSIIALQLIADNTSPLYKQMLDEGLINSTFSYSSFAGESYFSVMFDGESPNPDEVLSRINAEIERLMVEGIDEKRFEMFKRSMYGTSIAILNSVEACCNALVSAFVSNVDMFEQFDCIANMTSENVMDALKSVFDVENVAISIVEN